VQQCCGTLTCTQERAFEQEYFSVCLRRLRSLFEQQPGVAGDPLVWWKNGLRDPRLGHILSPLAPLARMYLSMPASSADLERSFSSASFLLDHRWRLTPMNLETQVVIRDWLLEQARTHTSDEDLLQYVSAFVEELGEAEVDE
jgi:hypothetical protein